jgi:uncharacterized membrane protein YfbV (UPF0208 family)
MYGRIMPTASIIMVLILYLINGSFYQSILYTAITAFAITMTVWWFWAVRSIGSLAKSNWLLHQHTEEIVNELKHARQDLREIRNQVVPQASDA